MTRFNNILRLFPLMLLVGLPSGCGKIDEINNRFDQAINQFERTRKAIISDSQHWKQHSETLIDGLSDEAKDIVKDGALGRFVDARSNNLIDESKTTLKMVESKILGYLNGVIVALKRKRDQAKREGGIPLDTVDAIIAEVIASVDCVEPFVGNITERSLSFVSKSQNLRLDLQDIVQFRGFGFHGRKFQVIGLDAQEERVWTAADVSVTTTTDFVITFVPQKAGLLPKQVETLVVIWTERKQETLASIVLIPNEQAVKAATRYIFTYPILQFRGYGDKNANVAFNAKISFVNAEGRQAYGTFQLCGEKEFWPRGKTESFPRFITMDPSHRKAFDATLELDSKTVLILELTMPSRSGGSKVFEYQADHSSFHTFYYRGKVPPLIVGFHTFYYRGKVPPLIVGFPKQMKRSELIRSGFDVNSNRATISRPIKLIPADWRGHIGLEIKHGHRTFLFDESEAVEFKRGLNAKTGQKAIQIRWKGNGDLI